MFVWMVIIWVEFIWYVFCEMGELLIVYSMVVGLVRLFDSV